MSESFNVATESAGQAHRVIATGELDIATVPVLDQAFEAAVGAGDAERIEVDLTGVTFIDSTGLRLLIRMAERCDRLRIRSTPVVDRLLQVTGLLDQLPLIQEQDGE